MLFDVIYDNKEIIIDKALELGSNVVDPGKEFISNIGETGKEIGEAVSGFFGNLGSVFG